MPGYASYRNFGSPRRYAGLAWAVGMHALLLVLIVSGVFKTSVDRILKKPLEAVVLQEVMVQPPPPLLPIPKPVVNEPKPSAPLIERPVQALPTPAPAQTEAPAKTERVAEPAPAPAPVVNTTQQHTSTVAAPVEPAHKATNTASAEAEYAGRVRAMLNASKRYPTGRQASQQRPQGVVKLWFTLNRAGNLLEAGVLEAADSNLLNDAALATVRRVTYPPFTTELWPGQDQHKFTVDIEFLPPA
jgi:protein TonB